MLEEAIDIFHRIPKFNCRRTTKSFNVLLEVLVSGGRVSEARELFESSQRLRIVPNVEGVNERGHGAFGRDGESW